MTEQEKRDKAIEEMTTVLDEVDCQDHNVCVEHRNILCNRCCAERLSDYVLRKADEVRKETAIEYSNKIDELVDWCISNKIGDDFDYEYFTNSLRNLRKEFGVEVEE